MEDQMTTTSKSRPGSISGCVIDCGKSEVVKPAPRKSKERSTDPAAQTQPIGGAKLELFCANPAKGTVSPERAICSNADGEFEFEDLAPGTYWVRCCAFAWEQTLETAVEPGCSSHICFEVPLAFGLQPLVAMEDCQPLTLCDTVSAGRHVLLRAGYDEDLVCDPVVYDWSAPEGSFLQ